MHLKQIIIILSVIITLAGCASQIGKTSQPVKAQKNNALKLASNEKAIVKNNARVVEHEIEIDSQSTEGGSLNYFTTNGQLEKFIVTFYGETGKVEHMFTLTNEKLQEYQRTYWEYNRPIYWNKEEAKELNDTEYFDLEKSKKAIDLFSIKDRQIEWLQKSGKNDIKQDEIIDMGLHYLSIAQADIRKQLRQSKKEKP
jgi:hypothetical protein